MRTLLVFVLALLLPAIASCGNDTVRDELSTRGVPSAAIRTEALDSAWELSVRSVGALRADFEGPASATVYDGLVEFTLDDGSASVLLEVQNLDPRSTGCHPSGIIVAEGCLDRANFPYVIFETSPVAELALGDVVCVAPRNGSAAELTADGDHVLHALRAVSPVLCPGGGEGTYEVRIARVVPEETGEQPLPQLGDEPIVIGGE